MHVTKMDAKLDVTKMDAFMDEIQKEEVIHSLEVT